MTTYLSRFAMLTAVAHLTLELSMNFLPVVYPTLITAFGLSYAQIGLIATVMTMFGALAQPIFGYLSDRWGANQVVIISIAWCGLVMGSVGFVQNYLMLLVLVACAALGSAAFHPAGAVLAAASANKGKGAAISIFSVGGNLGAALSPLWVSLGIALFGLSGTVIVIPVALLVTFLLYQQLILQPSLQFNSTTSTPVTPNPQQTKISNTVWLGLALITFFVMCRSWVQVALMTYLPEWIQSQGYSLAFGGQILAIFMISVSVGSFVGGPLSDQIGRWKVVVGSLTILAVMLWLFTQVPIYGQVILASGMGIMTGASFPVAIVMAQEIWPRGVGLASSLVLGLGWAPGGIGAWFTGRLADQSTLTSGLQWLTLPPLLAVVAILIYTQLRRFSTQG